MLTLAALFAISATWPAIQPVAQPAFGGPALHTQAANMAARPIRNRGISIRIPSAAPGLLPPRIDGPRDVTRPLIVIDPGHGGHDPGARNARSGTREKDLTLGIARALRDELLKGGRLRVALTREDDRFLALDERYGLAREMGAALFVSIHADASEESGAHGATVYTLADVASDQEAKQLAARENRADMLDGVALSRTSSVVTSILSDLTHRETMGASVRFAELLHREATALVPFRTPYHRQAALVVLKSPDTPSVLIETGYISNDSDAAWLASPNGKAQLAQGIARAIAVFAATHDVKE